MSSGPPNSQKEASSKLPSSNPSKPVAVQSTSSSNKTYVILRNLGEGSFGKVKEALHVATQEKIAVKVIEKEKVVTEDDDTRVRREISIMRKVKHPNIVQLYEVIETEKYHFMVMEYVEGGELADYIETRDRVALLNYLAQRERNRSVVPPIGLSNRLSALREYFASRHQTIQHLDGLQERPETHRLRTRKQLHERQRPQNELRKSLFCCT